MLIPIRKPFCFSWVLLVFFLATQALAQPDASGPWPCFAIDNSSKGADGARLLDVNGDGRLDIATGWEEGALIRAYLQPGPEAVTRPWPRVTVGKVKSPEDAVFVDLDGDGVIDVVSSCEGKTKAVYVHWAPKNPKDYLDESKWKTEPLPASLGKSWMFALPFDIDRKNGIDLVIGAKSAGAEIGFFIAPANPRDLAAWRYQPIRPSGWIMSLVAADMNGDGREDVLYTDRKGSATGIGWLENPTDPDGEWIDRTVARETRQTMFLAQADLDQDGLLDILTAAKDRDIIWHRRFEKTGIVWKSHIIKMPNRTGTAKGVAVGDIDLDGRQDIVFSCEQADSTKGLRGLMWLSYDKTPKESNWTAHDIGGILGLKYDLVELLDIDGDGDLDVITCEERELNALLWYQNPTKGRRADGGIDTSVAK